MDQKLGFDRTKPQTLNPYKLHLTLPTSIPGHRVHYVEPETPSTPTKSMTFTAAAKQIFGGQRG